MKFVNLVLFKFCLLLSLYVISVGVNANEIDSLKTDKQVIDFFKKVALNDDKYNYIDLDFNYNNDKAIKDSLGSKNWIKTDFDYNGETDLILFNLGNFTQIIAIFSNNGLFSRINSNTSMKFKYYKSYPTIKNINGENMILIYHREITNRRRKLEEELNYTPVECDTIMFENGMFLNYYKNLEKHKIESIEIMGEDNDLGTVVKVKIDFINLNDSCLEARYNSSIYPLKEKFTYKLTQSEILKIKYLLELSNFSALNNNVRFGIEHYYQFSIEIVYDNGKVKKIEDSGGVVNYNFAEIYNMIYNFKWVKSK